MEFMKDTILYRFLKTWDIPYTPLVCSEFTHFSLILNEEIAPPTDFTLPNDRMYSCNFEYYVSKYCELYFKCNLNTLVRMYTSAWYKGSKVALKWLCNYYFVEKNYTVYAYYDLMYKCFDGPDPIGVIKYIKICYDQMNIDMLHWLLFIPYNKTIDTQEPQSTNDHTDVLQLPEDKKIIAIKIINKMMACFSPELRTPFFEVAERLALPEMSLKPIMPASALELLEASYRIVCMHLSSKRRGCNINEKETAIVEYMELCKSSRNLHALTQLLHSWCDITVVDDSNIKRCMDILKKFYIWFGVNAHPLLKNSLPCYDEEYKNLTVLVRRILGEAPVAPIFDKDINLPMERITEIDADIMFYATSHEPSYELVD